MQRIFFQSVAMLAFFLFPTFAFSHDFCIKGPAGYQNTVSESYQFPDDFDFSKECTRVCSDLTIKTARHVTDVSVPAETKLSNNSDLYGKEFQDSKRTHFGSWDGTYSVIKKRVDMQCGRDKGYGAVCSCDIKVSS